MWEKCGVQNQKIGVWARCLIIPFVVLKTPFCGVKNGCQNSGGWRMSKTNQPVPTYGKSLLRRNQIAATIIYCNVLLLQLELQYFNSLQQGTPPCGNTAATLSLWPNMTTFYPDPEDALKPWNRQVKLPGFRKLEIGNKTCDPTGPTKPVDSMAQNYHQNPRSRKRNLQQMRAQVIFGLVWDFRSRPFSLFLGSFLEAKRARFLTPFEVSIQRDSNGKITKKPRDWERFGLVSAGFSPKQRVFLTPKKLKSDTAFGKFGTSREPVGNQSGTSREPVGKIRAPPQKAQKCWFLQGFGTFLVEFGTFCRVFAKNRPNKCQIPAKTSIFVPFGAVHGFSRLVPDWFPTGSRLVPNLPKAVSDFGPKFAELDDFLGFGKCFGGFGAGGG